MPSTLPVTPKRVRDGRAASLEETEWNALPGLKPGTGQKPGNDRCAACAEIRGPSGRASRIGRRQIGQRQRLVVVRQLIALDRLLLGGRRPRGGEEHEERQHQAGNTSFAATGPSPPHPDRHRSHPHPLATDEDAALAAGIGRRRRPGGALDHQGLSAGAQGLVKRRLRRRLPRGTQSLPKRAAGTLFRWMRPCGADVRVGRMARGLIQWPGAAGSTTAVRVSSARPGCFQGRGLQTDWTPSSGSRRARLRRGSAPRCRGSVPAAV